MQSLACVCVCPKNEHNSSINDSISNCLSHCTNGVKNIQESLEKIEEGKKKYGGTENQSSGKAGNERDSKNG